MKSRHVCMMVLFVSSVIWTWAASPNLLVHHHVVDDTAAGCDQDGIADYGEVVQFLLYIDNRGDADATDVWVSLTAADCLISGKVSLGTIAAGQVAVEVWFDVEVSDTVPCPAEDWEFEASLTCHETGTTLEPFYETVNADWRMSIFFDDMECAGDGGWTHSAGVGSDDWQKVTTSAHSPVQSWFSADYPSAKDVYLVTPALSLYDSAKMSFWHKRNMEVQGNEWAYDGCVLEISTNGGGTWTDLGPDVLQGGYSHTVFDWAATNPLHGRPVWSGNMDWTLVKVDLSAYAPGEALLRFRLGCDEQETAPGEAGWWIDDVRIEEGRYDCHHQPCSSDCTYGDLDFDGSCDADDVLLLAHYLAGNPAGFTCDEAFGDLNRNGGVDGHDLIILLNFVCNNISIIPLP
ncbi:MAG: choice-of-anchor J domain-containing protein [Acidobacteria bacterium]|nr:choice-of-anchor J domain-containing protein [Acidobacteriota bacterium]